MLESIGYLLMVFCGVVIAFVIVIGLALAEEEREEEQI